MESTAACFGTRLISLCRVDGHLSSSDTLIVWHLVRTAIKRTIASALGRRASRRHDRNVNQNLSPPSAACGLSRHTTDASKPAISGFIAVLAASRVGLFPSIVSAWSPERKRSEPLKVASPLNNCRKPVPRREARPKRDTPSVNASCSASPWSLSCSYSGLDLRLVNTPTPLSATANSNTPACTLNTARPESQAPECSSTLSWISPKAPTS
jgi:hypothetical protein